MKSNNNNFIGIFDSGVGGISLLNECIKLLPNENYVYFADTNNFPYGIKSKDEITQIGINAISEFYHKNTKELIIACNTMSTSNMTLFKETFKGLEIIGTFPDFSSVFKSGLELKTSSISFQKDSGIIINKIRKKILIISTTATSKCEYLKKLVKDFNKYIDIYVEPADFIVTAVESGKLNDYLFKEELNKLFKEYKSMDYLFLGCTHFPFAINVIRDIISEHTQILSSNIETAKKSYEYLKSINKLSHNENPYIEIIDANLNDDKIELYNNLLNKAPSQHVVFKVSFDE